MTFFDLTPWAYISVAGHFIISAITGFIVYHFVIWFSIMIMRYGVEKEVKQYAIKFGFLSAILIHLFVDMFHYI